MSISNLAGLLSHELGALMTHWLGVTEQEFGNLWLLVLLTNLSTLLPLPMLFLLPSATSQGDAESVHPQRQRPRAAAATAAATAAEPTLSEEVPLSLP